jgi:hypothetical protein
MLGDAVLIWRVWDGFLVRDAGRDAFREEPAFYKFGRVVDAERSNLLFYEVLGGRAETHEEIGGFIAGFHEIKRGKARKAVNKKDKVTVRTKTRGKRAADVRMNTLEQSCGPMRSFVGKWGTFDVCLGTNSTGRLGTVVKVKSVNGSTQTFNAYVSHQAVGKPD